MFQTAKQAQNRKNASSRHKAIS